LSWLPVHRKTGNDSVLNGLVQQWLSFVLLTVYDFAELVVAAWYIPHSISLFGIELGALKFVGK
jgi:hypothetical protein